MPAIRINNKTVSHWALAEVEAMEDLYENSRNEACDFVLELIAGNEYDELADARIRKLAVAAVENLRTKARSPR